MNKVNLERRSRDHDIKAARAPLLNQPPIRQTTLHPSIEALHHRPETFVDNPLPLRALHVDTVLHGEHIRRILTALEPPSGDDVAYLQGLEELKVRLGPELAVSGARAQEPSQIPR